MKKYIYLSNLFVSIFILSMPFYSLAQNNNNAGIVTYKTIIKKNSEEKGIYELSFNNQFAHYLSIEKEVSFKMISTNTMHNGSTESITDTSVEYKIIKDSIKKEYGILTDNLNKLLYSVYPPFKQNNIKMAVMTKDQHGNTQGNKLDAKEFTKDLAKDTFIPTYYVKEKAYFINWELQDETKKVNNFTCQKAIGKFRGRNYTAWFTADIPLSYGPWKLNGLPGLILEVYDDESFFYAVADKITLKPVEINNNKYLSNKYLTIKNYINLRDSTMDANIAAKMQQIKSQFGRESPQFNLKMLKQVEIEKEFEEE